MPLGRAESRQEFLKGLGKAEAEALNQKYETLKENLKKAAQELSDFVEIRFGMHGDKKE